MSAPQSGSWQRLRAMSVHAYTALGVVLALLMVHMSYAGEVEVVLWLFLAAMIIDGSDGFLARRFRVKEVVPGFDGALLDNIIDYITYAFAPMVLLWSAGYLPGGWLGGVVASVPLLASCYQFCRSDAKTDDHFFVGFPSYWNIAAFYLIVLGASTAATTTALLVLTVLVFVPIKYVYPSRTETAWWLTMTLTMLWLGLYALILVQYPSPSLWLIALSGGYMLYYAALSLRLTLNRRNQIGGAADSASAADSSSAVGGNVAVRHCTHCAAEL
ncbi:CDP-alcohol phosphatidyltransferase family protein [Nesterenkonia sp. LB17]|uniref:CDP-alcohol phosphatidyltransferase family protein n=1 Tax=Nesterenkonia sp. LB17 TaxID=2901230 RepID=UPI001F4D1EAE|nr:CDP-alcohol phosphatidyltransferase family protein [Nesterenkonia sp. LB17]MCH8565029.1 CDP-alcohol phosphatidyltransferase family protein [Nesterenkonia sp. LB17]